MRRARSGSSALHALARVRARAQPVRLSVSGFALVVHRDLKPENILCSEDLSLVAVADFGIADLPPDLMVTTLETRPGARMANFGYSAPEQRDGSGTVDHCADIYALGLILNEMFTQRVPSDLITRVSASMRRTTLVSTPSLTG